MDVTSGVITHSTSSASLSNMWLCGREKACYSTHVCVCVVLSHNIDGSGMMDAGPAGGWLLCRLLPREERGYRSLIPDRRLMNVSGMMVPPNEGARKGQSVSPLPDKQEVAIIHPATRFEECLFCSPGIKTAACMYLRACFLELFHKLQSAAAVQNHLHTTVQPDRPQSNRGGFRGFKLWRWSRPPHTHTPNSLHLL